MTDETDKQMRSVLVLGGGIAGTAVARRLARAGLQVHLVERAADIGGRAIETGCKAVEVCLRCNACVAAEILRSVRYEPNVCLHTETELVRLEPGSNGQRFAAFIAPHASAALASDSGPLAADAVVVAVGYAPYDPGENSAYGYGAVPNVITGVEAERQLVLQHRITRPSDGQPPKKIAFIQCVGSRTEEIYRRPEDTDYCSTVCCAYALRIARRLQHDVAGAAVSVFYMDIQNFGKGFCEFFRQCKDSMAFVRSRPYRIKPGENGAVRVVYTPEQDDAASGGAVAEEEFELVILAVGMCPPADASRLADTLGVPLDEQGFFGLKDGGALPDLQRQGIFAVGACESPKDIAGCIAQADAVSLLVLSEV